LHAALERREAGGVARAYLGSCDAAGLSERHVAFMLERLSRRSRAPTTSAVEPWSSIIAAVPIDEHGRRHPLAAAVAVAGLRARAAEQLAAGRHRLQELFVGPDVVE